MNTLCVFVSANFGRNPAYLEAIKQLAQGIAERNIHLIYGGGKLGLMGILANTVMENGGKVTGVITQSLYEQEAHLGLSKLHVVETMKDRKLMMADLADGFITCPGGLGTLEETFEIWNASKIDLHNKPLGIFNTNHYFDKLLEFIDFSIHEEFLHNKTRELICISDNACKLLDGISDKYQQYSFA